MSVLAHNYIGKNYLALQEYEKAMYHFEIAGNRVDYSNAFWEVRNAHLQSSLGTVIIIFIVVLLILFLLRIIDKRYPFKYKIKAQIKRITNISIVDDLLYSFRVMKHPLDSFYEIKKAIKVQLGAWIIFITFLSYICGR